MSSPGLIETELKGSNRKRLSAKDLLSDLDDDLNSEATNGENGLVSDRMQVMESVFSNGDMVEKLPAEDKEDETIVEPECRVLPTPINDVRSTPILEVPSENSPNNLHPDDMALLAKLEEANRQLEAERRLMHGVSPSSQRKAMVDQVVYEEPNQGHSRQGSLSSEISSISASSCTSNPPTEDVSDDLWSTWKTIVEDWNNKSKKKSFNLKELVRKGIPTHFRGIVWPMLCEAHLSKDRLKYSEYMRMASPCEKLIRRDIARTYPEHHFFKDKNGGGQEILFNVMKAYSLHDREVGYCQGSGFIVGLLLMQMPEEDAFAVFVKVMQCLRLRELYKPNMAEIGLCMFQLESMIQEQIPDLYSHFQVHGLCVSMFAAPWFLTLLTATLPLSLACRVFDIFLLEGLEIIFQTGLAILQMFSAELQTLDMEGMLKVLQKDLPNRLENESERLFNMAFQVKYNAKRMKKLEKDYVVLKSKEEEEQTEIRRLKTENRLLRQRIENLEGETATLADRLIHDQVKYAQQSEEIYTLRRAVSYSRRQSCDPSYKQQEDSVAKPDNAEMEAAMYDDDDDRKASTVEELQKVVADMVNEEIKAKAIMHDLRARIQELEKAQQQCSSEPSIDLQNLQDQLIASKMREAEASLSTKELEQKVNDLDRYWQKHLESANTPDGKGKSGRSKLQEVSDELMSAKIREANMTSELTELKQKFMELETKNHICERQIKRLDGENDKLKESRLEQDVKEKEMENQIKDLTRQLNDMETKKREEEILLRIKEAEYSQILAEMRQRIAELEIQNQELQTTAQLHERGISGDQNELENKVVDLQEELQMLQLRMSQKVMSASLLANSLSVETDSDYDLDDIDSNRLRLTDSMGPQLANEVFCTSTPKNGQIKHMADSFEVSDGDDEPVKLNQDMERNQMEKPPRHSCTGMDFDKTPTNDANNSNSFSDSPRSIVDVCNNESLVDDQLLVKKD